MLESEIIEKTKIEIDEELLTSSEEKGYTYLHCIYYTSPKWSGGWWVNIWKTSYLVCNGIKYPLIHAIDIPYAPQKHFLHYTGDSLKFTLIFPALPKECKTFDFIEECRGGRGLSARGIIRSESGIHKVRVS